jgi:hypothetical protein
MLAIAILTAGSMSLHPPAATAMADPAAGPPVVQRLVGTIRWTTEPAVARQAPSILARQRFVIPAGTAVRIQRVASDRAGNRWNLVTTIGWSGWIEADQTSAVLRVAEDETAVWQRAHASSYGIGDGFLGTDMACGGELTPSIPAIASSRLPCGTVVVLRAGGHTVSARVLDRQPFPTGISFDLAPAVCAALRDCSGDLQIEWHVET